MHQATILEKEGRPTSSRPMFSIKELDVDPAMLKQPTCDSVSARSHSTEIPTTEDFKKKDSKKKLPITPINLTPIDKSYLDKYAMNPDQGHKKALGCKGNKSFNCVKSGEIIKNIKGKKFESISDLYSLVVEDMNKGFGAEVYYVHIN